MLRRMHLMMKWKLALFDHFPYSVPDASSSPVRLTSIASRKPVAEKIILQEKGLEYETSTVHLLWHLPFSNILRSI